MLSNKEIKVLLQNQRELSKFARFLDITQQALYKRLSKDKMKDNLSGAYYEFLFKKAEKSISKKQHEVL